jgi:hypothetical protein
MSFIDLTVPRTSLLIVQSATRRAKQDAIHISLLRFISNLDLWGNTAYVPV